MDALIDQMRKRFARGARVAGDAEKEQWIGDFMFLHGPSWGGPQVTREEAEDAYNRRRELFGVIWD